jgi:hypothetical protein
MAAGLKHKTAKVFVLKEFILSLKATTRDFYILRVVYDAKTSSA